MKNVLITGVGSGFGKAIKNKFAAHNYNIFALTKTKLKKNENFKPYFCDFKKINSINAKLTKILKINKSFDFIILNAGSLGPIDLTKNISINKIKEVLDINLFANKIIIDNILLKKIKFKSLIAISSGASISTKFGWFSYSASKVTLRFLIENYALENKKYHFINYTPGIINTNMQKKIRVINPKIIPSVRKFKILHQKNKIQSPDEAAKKLYLSLKNLLKLKSGSYIDARDI